MIPEVIKPLVRDLPSSLPVQGGALHFMGRHVKVIALLLSVVVLATAIYFIFKKKAFCCPKLTLSNLPVNTIPFKDNDIANPTKGDVVDHVQIARFLKQGEGDGSLTVDEGKGQVSGEIEFD